ncbi:MAG: hypothetical protein CO118_09710 [Flavobacteriales bacterium CG_4_9_14_3_um_filter_32_8]|nr:MAG: hypothetical protein CO118_09710 [Flavobacteriales bacterium CG_4_9_14_3_um_filter_32_8]
MKPIVNKTFLILSIFLLFSCETYKSPYFNELLISEKGNLRGAEIGMTLENVKAIEDVKFLMDETPEYLNYDYNINMGNSYTVTYDFSETNELYEIEIAIYLDAILDADVLFNDFSTYFNNKYKKGKKEDDGYSTWLTNSSLTGHHITVSIINDSKDYGFITILVSDLDY